MNSDSKPSRRRSPSRPTHSYYNEAKHYEYVERNLPKAVECYYLAIEHGDKADSAIKDLAAALHQLGRTKQAVDFLRNHRQAYRGDLEKYDNLIVNLAKQIEAPSGKNFNKYLLALGVPANVEVVKSMFEKNQRISSVEFYEDLAFERKVRQGNTDGTGYSGYCLISFHSYSSAKKTLDCFLQAAHPEVQLFWVNINKLIVGRATSDETMSPINSTYHGFVKFHCCVIVEDEKDLVQMHHLQDIEGIWSRSDDGQVDNRQENSRIELENQTKLAMLIDNKYRSIL